MSETANTKGPTPEEQEATKVATKCIHDCHLEQLINDSKFLREESLHELVKVRVTGLFFNGNLNLTLKVSEKIVAFANSVDPDEVAHNEPPYQDLHCFPSSL